MPDPSEALLLLEIVEDAPFGVLINADGVLIDVMQQIKIEICNAAFLQLLLKDGGGVIAGRDLVSGVFAGQAPALPGILRQSLAENDLAEAAVVGIGGVEVVDAVGHGIVDHVLHLRLVDALVRTQGQAHRAEAEPGKGKLLKIVVNHSCLLL